MASRRDVLKKLGIGMAAVTVGTAAASKAETLTAFAEGESLKNAPWWLLSPLTIGSSVGKGWKVKSLGSIEQGASILTLQNVDKREYNVHICVHDGMPKGLAYTEFLDLVLMDGGQGDRPTDEAFGRVLLGIAKRIRHNELESQESFDELARLETHSERVGRYGPENLV